MKGKQLIATVLEGIRMTPFRQYLTSDGKLVCTCKSLVSAIEFAGVAWSSKDCCRHIAWLFERPSSPDICITFTPLGREEFDWRLAARKLEASAQ